MFATHKTLKVAIALLCTIGFVTDAAARDYISSKMKPRPPSQDLEMYKGDLPEDFKPGFNNPTSHAGKRARVEAYVKEQMKGYGQLTKGAGDQAYASTPAEFQTLLDRANKGSTTAYYQVGQVLQYGQAGQARDQQAAAQWYAKAAERNYSPAFSALGQLYMDTGTQQKSSMWNNIKSRFSNDGNPVEKDNQAALEWFKAGAKANDPLSHRMISTMYAQGLGVEKNKELAAWHQAKARDVAEQSMNRARRSKEQELRREAEIREGIFQERDVHWGEESDEHNHKKPDTLTISETECAYVPAEGSAGEYSKVFRANCPEGVELEATQVAVTVPGMDCVAQKNTNTNDAATHQILCKPRAAQFEIGGSVCSVQPIGKAGDSDESFRLYCGGGAGVTDVKSVTYLGMNCEVQPYSAGQGEPSYDLFCKKATPPEPEYAKKLKLGGMMCDVEKQDREVEGVKVIFTASCGEMPVEAKEKALAESLRIHGHDCTLEAWEANTEGKTFEIYCHE